MTDKPPLTDDQKRLLKRQQDVKRNQHPFESTNPRKPERCDLCGFDQKHPYHGG